MMNQEIIGAILSKDAGRVAEAKTAIKTMLDARATKFRSDSTAFVAKSLFENDLSKDMVAKHKAAAEHHRNQASLGIAKTSNELAAKLHDEAAVAHSENHPRKDSKTRKAEDQGEKADIASQMSH
jgi:hypothetical protein